MKAFSIRGPATKGFYGPNAKTLGNPTGGETPGVTVTVGPQFSGNPPGAWGYSLDESDADPTPAGGAISSPLYVGYTVSSVAWIDIG